MDPNLVFAKTAAGEQAVQERTRLVQRNLRNVLIVVDGRSSVQELCDKVGKPKVVRSALEQLLRDGYIEPAVVAATAWEKGVQAAGDLAGAASEKLAAMRAPAEAPPQPPAEAERMPPPRMAAAPSPFADAPPPSPFGAAPAASPFAVAEPKPLAIESAPPAAKAASRAEKREAAKQEADEKIVIKPVRRGSSSSPGVLRWVGLGVVGLVVLSVVGIFVFPYGMYRAGIEASLSKSFGQPVKFGAVHGSLVPAPALLIDQLQIGDAGDVTVAQLRAVPSIGSLFGGPRVFREVVVAGAKLPAERLPMLVGGLQGIARGDDFVVQRLGVERATIMLRDLEVANLAGETSGADGATRLTLASSDNTLKFDLLAAASGVEVSAELSNWKPLPASTFIWDALTVQGTINGTSFVSRKLEGRLFDGAVQGQATLDWGPTASLRGEIVVENGSARRLRDGLGLPIAVDGGLAGVARISASADKVAALREKAVLDGDFRITRGGVEAIDLVEAVRRGSRAPSQGGSTRFDLFAGRFSWDGKLVRLSALDIGSGAMQAGGALSVAPGMQVSGSFDVRLKGSASDLRMAVAISGPLKNPRLQGSR